MNAPLSPMPSGGTSTVAAVLDALPVLIDRAARALAGARSSAEVLEARDIAGYAYDAAKRAGRVLRAKGAHDELVAAALRAQGDALLIEAGAKVRLADEYDEARDRGEVAPQGNYRRPDIDSGDVVATLADLGLTPDGIYRARQIRDAEAAQPGFVRSIVESRLQEGLEPNHRAVRTGVQRLLSFESEADLDAHVRRRRAEKQAAKAEKRVDLSHKLAERTRAAAAELGRRLYPVVYVDFPWRTETWSEATGMDRAPDNHYPTMSDDEVMAFRLPAGPTAILFMWATVPKLGVAMAAMAGFGFAYKSLWAWTKPDIGTGYYGRENIELLLIGTRGAMMGPLMGQQPPMAQPAPRGRRHSEKPALFADCIARIYPELPRVELFARGPRVGWDVWGNESDGGPA